MGKLIIEGSAFQKEIDFAQEMTAHYDTVRLRGKKAAGADLVLDGILWELKILEAATENAVQQNIKKGLKQAKGRVILDGRKVGLSFLIGDQGVNLLKRMERLDRAKVIKIFTSEGIKIYTFDSGSQFSTHISFKP